MERVYSYIDLVYDNTVGIALQSLGQIITFPIHLGKEEAVTPAPAESETEEGEDARESFKTVATLLEERSVSGSLSKSIAYIGSTRVPLFAAPTKDFDTVLTTLSYGAMVMVLEEKGRFSHIVINETDGWVLRDDLSDRAAFVYPEFVIGEENGVDDPNTLRLRACIKDEFCGIESEVSLQAGEYVLYKLMRKGKTIQWPETRPRTPGRWHTILRGQEKIRIGIAPKSGSIMECTLENDMGHVAYVEAVFPDERITISEANYPDRGIYSERTLRKDEWQALNPVFIEVN